MSPAKTEHSPASSALAHELRTIVGKLKRRLREQTQSGDFTPSQVSVLLHLEKDGPATTSALARAEGMRPQSMAAVISALEQAGMVKGRPDSNDGRQTLISLTAACKRWIDEGRAARQDWLSRQLHARLSSTELTEVAHAIELLKRLVDH